MQEFESSVIMSKIIVTIWVFLLFSCHHNENLDNSLKGDYTLMTNIIRKR